MASGKCSVVVRACDEEKHIGRLLSGILKQRSVDPEIVLVDSGSSDATLAIASRYPVRILETRPDDFSFGRSLNLGCASATHEIIVIASAHVYPVYPDWLEQLLKPFGDSRMASSVGTRRPVSASTRSSPSGIRRLRTPTRIVRSATTPTPQSGNPFG